MGECSHELYKKNDMSWEVLILEINIKSQIFNSQTLVSPYL